MFVNIRPILGEFNCSASAIAFLQQYLAQSIDIGRTIMGDTNNPAIMSNEPPSVL